MGGGGEGECTGEQIMAVVEALGEATTTECQTLVGVMNADDDTDATDAQICACMSSGHDFSALSGFDCKMESSDSETIATYVSGGGVCSDDSSSSALSLFFAFAALFFGLA